MDNIIILLAGMLSGFVSEIGAVGSLLSLPMLISLGIPPVLANGTNRVAVLALYTSAYGYYAYEEEPVLHAKYVFRVFLPIALGVALGAFVANLISNEFTHWMVVAFSIFVVVFNTNTPIREDVQITTTELKLKIVNYLALFCVGVYAGLVQSGMSHLIFYVLANVLLVDFMTAKYLKFYFSMLVTPVALVIFMCFSNVDYHIAPLLIVGGVVGGWFGSVQMRKWSVEQNRGMIRLVVFASIVYLMLLLTNYRLF